MVSVCVCVCVFVCVDSHYYGSVMTGLQHIDEKGHPLDPDEVDDEEVMSFQAMVRFFTSRCEQLEGFVQKPQRL